MLPTDDMIAKIEKLLNLADHPSANPGEAANAAARARDLLEKYNLDLEVIRKRQGKQEGIPVTLIWYTIPGSGSMVWRRSLVDTVAKVSYCKYIGTTGHPKLGKFIGQEHNIKAAIYLVETLINEIQRLARVAWKELDPAKKETMNRAKWINSFCRGARRTVNDRLLADMRASETASESSTALVIVHSEAINRYIESQHMHLKNSKPRTANVYTAAFASGEEAGKGIAFRRGVEAGDPARQIG